MAPNCATYVELGLGLGEAHLVGGVDKEDDAAHLREVVLPQPPGWATGRTGTFGQRDGPGGRAREWRARGMRARACGLARTLLVAAEVVRGEADGAHRQLLRRCMHVSSARARQERP